MKKAFVNSLFSNLLLDLSQGKTNTDDVLKKISAVIPDAEAMPFLVKSTQRVCCGKMTAAQRLEELRKGGFNIFNVGEENGVLVDFLTDSGTGSMSDEQWAALIKGSEWYAGAKSFRVFQEAFKEIFGDDFEIIPAHQGRSAESILLEALKQSGLVEQGKKVVFNAAFDTTAGWVEQVTGFLPVNLYCPEMELPLSSEHPFKGNLDVTRLEERIAQKDVGAVFLTITNNTGGGQSVSLQNIRGVSALCRKNSLPLFFDACRFAENAFFIQKHEHPEMTIREIVREMFCYADGATFSAKKDGKANIGGAILIRKGLFVVTQYAKILTIAREGFVSYGGLAGRDLEAVAQGIRETTTEDYLKQRIGQVQYLHSLLDLAGIPLLKPCGGHAVYLDARSFLPQVPQNEYRGLTLSLVLFAKYGIRSCEVGDFMHGKKDEKGALLQPAKNDFLRLAIPRLTYSSEHMLYTASCLSEFNSIKEKITNGMRVKENFVNNGFDHFFTRFEPINEENFNEAVLGK